MTNTVSPLIPIESTDFASVNVNANNFGAPSITLTAMDDDIAMEQDTFLLKYVHTNGEEFVDVVEGMGEFIRHMATVEIIDTDSKYNEPLTICSSSLK